MFLGQSRPSRCLPFSPLHATVVTTTLPPPPGHTYHCWALLAVPTVTWRAKRRRFPLAGRAAELENLTVPMLKEKLRERGLPVSGRKSQLLERLRSASSMDAGSLEDSELETLTVVKLQSLLRQRGLPMSGRKGELISRLVAAGFSGTNVPGTPLPKLDAVPLTAPPKAVATGKTLSLWLRQRPNCTEEEEMSLPTGKWFRGVVRSVMTFGLFVELDLGQSDGPWGFVAPEHLKKQLAQKLRCEDGSSKVHVKKDAIQMGEELQVRVLANSAMSNHLFLSTLEESADVECNGTASAH